MKNTGVMCMVSVQDDSRLGNVRSVDLGNYFRREDGKKCLVTRKVLARQYGHLVNVPIYVRKSDN